MIDLNVSTQIYRPIKQVFEYVSVPENEFQWQYGTLADTSMPDGASKIGSLFRSIGHLLGQRTQGLYEVTECEPNHKYGFKSLSGPLHSKTSYTFDFIGSSISIQAHAVNNFQMNKRLLEKMMKKQLKENLALLKNLLESRGVLHNSLDQAL